MRSTVVLLPGNMCDARLWNGHEGVLRQQLLGRGFRVVDSDTTRDATIAGMAERALDEVEGTVIPIGFSMGAIVGLGMAQLAPARIAGMALFGLNAGGDLPERSAVRLRQQAEVRRGGLERVIVEELKPNYLAQANRHNRALLELLREMGLSLGPAVFLSQSEALRTRPDLRDAVGSIEAPFLFGCGAEDTLCPPSWHSDWAAMANDSELVIFQGAGHMLPLEAPHEFAETIISWLEKKDLG
jgi:pimeloyl-ACP methyl ester carboxylesterase